MLKATVFALALPLMLAVTPILAAQQASAQVLQDVQGRHLWSTRAQNGVMSYVAAFSFGDMRTKPMIEQQLAAAAAVERVVFSTGGQGPLPVTGAWSATISAGLPPALALEVEDELARLLVPMSLPRTILAEMPLASVRMFMAFAPGTVRRMTGPNEPDEITKTVRAFADARAAASLRDGGMLALRFSTEEELKALFAPFQATAMPPEAVFRRVLDDRRANGPIADRILKAYLAGEWNQHADFDKLMMLALTGNEVSAPSIFPRGMAEMAELSAAVLTERPTLLLVLQTNDLPGDQGLLSRLQRLGLVITAVPLPGDMRP